MKNSKILINVYKKCPFRWFVYFLYYLLQAVIPYVYSFLIAIILNKLIIDNFFNQSVIVTIILASLVFAINTTIYKWGPLLYDYVTFKLRKKFQKDFFSKLAKEDVLYFQKRENLEKNSFAENAIGFDFFHFGSATILFVISLFTLIFASIALFSYSIVVFLITIAVSITLYFFKKHLINNEIKFNDSLKTYDLQLNYYKRVYEDKNAVFEFKIYNLFDIYSKKIIEIETLIQNKVNIFAKKQSVLWFLFYFIKFVFNIVIALILLNIVKESKSPTIGALYFGIQLFNNFIGDFDERLNDIISLKVSKKYINDYYDIINKKNNYTNNIIKSDEKDYLIKANDLNFTYDNEANFSLKDVNIKILKNKTIAILGENGSGKSTLVNILLKTYNNNLCQYSTNIFVDNKIGAIFQDYHKYSFKLRDIVLLGDLNKEYRDEDIISTFYYLDATNILNKVSLDDYLGDSYNLGGKNISEGEWQKVNLCKVFIKKDREIYVFDEPTSSLDPKAEYMLYSNIKNYCNNKTSILISHRIGFAKLADYIYVMENGRIIEEGTNDDLLKQNGKYTKLYHEQMKYYDKSILEDIKI